MAFTQEYRPNRWRVRFAVGKDRQIIHLPKGTTRRQAERFRENIEAVVAHFETGCTYPAELVMWLSKLTKPILRKLGECGLVTYRETADLTLAKVFDNFIERRKSKVKPLTVNKWKNARHWVGEFFLDTLLKDVTVADANDFIESLKLAPATRRLIANIIKQVVRDAVDRELVARNVFESLASAPLANPSRARFVKRETVDRVLEYLPNDSIRLAVLLTRYGGLRCPSEVNSLKWSDVDWERNRITIQSCKTAKRAVPIFPELYELLRSEFETSDDPINVVSVQAASYRRCLSEAISRAGIDQWPRLWHNMRATRQTELAREFPSHVVCSWLGNSVRVSEKHYLQVTDEDFDRAAHRAPPGAPLPDANRRDKSERK